MTKSSVKSITVKPEHAYGQGSNFLYHCIQIDSYNYTVVTPTYLPDQSTQYFTFKACAKNWAAPESYNFVGIWSAPEGVTEPRIEKYESYDATDQDTKKVEITRTWGDSTRDYWDMCYGAGIYTSDTESKFTCYLWHRIYRKDAVEGYALLPGWFKVPYRWKLNEGFDVGFSAKLVYRGTGTPSEKSCTFMLVEAESNEVIDVLIEKGTPDIWFVLTVSADDGDFTEDMQEFYFKGLIGSYYMFSFHFAIKEHDSNEESGIYIRLEEP